LVGNRSLWFVANLFKTFIVFSFLTEYPPSAFYFKVIFTLTGGLVDTSFQDVSGISLEIGVEDVEEGGENRFVHKLPKAAKHGNLVLKRGIAGVDSPLVLWCIDTIEADRSLSIVTMPVMVYLMNEYQIPIRGWLFDNAYPVKWDTDAFNSTKNEVALETIELAYNTVNRIL
jgi:phage tail-like protein